MIADAGHFRAGFVAIIGAPNAGKSTLLNTLIGQKISIVTHKKNTTRTTIRGIKNLEGAQIIYVDTPGIFEGAKRLDKAMVNAASSHGLDADILALMIDCTQKNAAQLPQHILSLLQNSRHAILLLNKVDAIKKEALIPLTSTLNAQHNFAATFMISALKNKGIEDLEGYIAQHLPPSPPLFPTDQISDLPARLMAAEFTREQILLHLHEEIPYRITVVTESFETDDKGIRNIQQIAYVKEERHKGIIIGKKGETLKSISQKARLELEDALEEKIFLKIHVKVDEKWDERAEYYQMWGL